MEYTHPEDIKMLQCVGTVRICEIPISQTQSAFNALLCLQPPHPKDIIPRRGLITGAKIQIIFDIAKLFWCKSVMCRGNT